MNTAMEYERIVEPPIEPVTLEEVKQHARIYTSDDDAYVHSLLVGARRYAEDVLTWESFVTQTWDGWLDDWPAQDFLELPRPPLQTVTHIKYYDEDDTEFTLAATNYRVNTVAVEGKVVLKSGQSWPSATLRTTKAINVQFVAGYGDDASDVPDSAVHIIKLLVGHWYEHREPVPLVIGAIPRRLPLAVDALVGQHATRTVPSL